jgi:hypothetical protein
MAANMNQPKGRDIMAVFTFYNGDVIEQKIVSTEHCEAVTNMGQCMAMKFIQFDNGVIRQTKDIEKVVWSYC